jgi:hypothetical protein
MPIEVRELLIKANINENGKRETPITATAGQKPISCDEKKKLIKECAELVLELLQQRSGR